MKENKVKFLFHAALVIFALIMLIPFVWMFLTSIKTYEEAIRIPLQMFPKEIQWVNYEIVYNKFPFLTLYWNTIVVTVVTIAGQLFIVSLAAYAFARLNFPFKNILFIGMLGLMMVPGQIFLIPQFRLMVQMKLTNTLTALVLPSLFSVFGVFLLRQAFQTIPKDLDEAARMDGCSYFRIYWQIMLPLVTPNLVALGHHDDAEHLEKSDVADHRQPFD